MFQKLSTLFQTKRRIPEYDGPIQKRIVQLTILRDEAQNLIDLCDSIMNSFDEGEPPLKNTAEHASTCVRMLSEAIAGAHRDYPAFLAHTAAAFEGIGNAQRTFRHDLEEQLTGPFKSWISTDFARINCEIQKLHETKYEYDDAEAEFKKKNDDDKALKLAQAKLEHQRQMEAVKQELSKLKKIKDYHKDIFQNFLRIYGEYQQAIIDVIRKIGLEKWQVILASLDIQESGGVAKSVVRKTFKN